MADLKLSAIFSAAVSMLPSRVRVIPRYLNSVTSSRGVPSYVKVGITELPLLKKTITFVLSVFSLSPLNVCSHRICSAGVADFQPCLKWEQCHQHNHSEGFWTESRAVAAPLCTVKNLYMSLLKREYKRVNKGQPCFKPLLGATSSEILPPSMRRYKASCVHGLNDISQILRSLNFSQVSPKLLSWNTVVCSKQRGRGKQCTPSFLPF